MPGTRAERIADCGLRNADWKNRTLEFEVSNLKLRTSLLFNPQSEIRIPQSNWSGRETDTRLFASQSRSVTFPQDEANAPIKSLVPEVRLKLTASGL